MHHNGLHTYICELSLLPPGIPHSQAGSPITHSPISAFSSPGKCVNCVQMNITTHWGTPAFSKGSLSIRGAQDHRKGGGGPTESQTGSYPRDGGFPSAPAQCTHACTCSTDTHRWPPLCPWDACPKQRMNAGRAVTAAPPGVSAGPRQRGPCQHPETESSWACISLSPQPRAERRGQLVCSAGF